MAPMDKAASRAKWRMRITSSLPQCASTLTRRAACGHSPALSSRARSAGPQFLTPSGPADRVRAVPQPSRTMADAFSSTLARPDHMDPRRSFQGLILALQRYWADYGCVILQPYDMEVGAGTFHPATLRALGPKPWNVAFVQPSRRPKDGRYGENPNRMQHYYQLQV